MSTHVGVSRETSARIDQECLVTVSRETVTRPLAAGTRLASPKAHRFVGCSGKPPFGNLCRRFWAHMYRLCRYPFHVKHNARPLYSRSSIQVVRDTSSRPATTRNRSSRSSEPLAPNSLVRTITTRLHLLSPKSREPCSIHIYAGHRTVYRTPVLLCAQG